MKQVKYLAKNIGILTISQFGTKIISFFLVPLYTSILTTAEYGVFDFVLTTVQLLLPLLTLNIAEATLRFALDKENDSRKVYYISIEYVLFASLSVVLLTGINHVFVIFKILDDYRYYFVIMFITMAFGDVLSYYARGTDHVKQVGIAGVLSTAIIVSLNILFLLVLDIGLVGYFLSHIISYFVQVLYLLISCKTPRISSLEIDENLQTNMVSYSKPLIANAIAWWINNASDRYIVTWICGISEMGIYSVGYKIPTVLSVFQTIFNQAWSLSAVKEYNSSESHVFFSKMYNYYNACMTVMCAVIIALSKVFARVLYAKDFYEAWRYVPFLLISIVFGALAGYIGGIFTAVKDSKIIAISTVIGALVNIVLNVLLIYCWGAIGAAVATAVCYIVVWVIRIWRVKRYVTLSINFVKDITAYLILFCQSILLLFIYDDIMLYLLEFVCILSILCLNLKLILSIFRSVLKVMSKDE